MRVAPVPCRGHRRVRARLPLRQLTTRGAAGGLCRSGCAREPAQSRARHPHTRGVDDTFSILEHEGVPSRTIFHCFTGGEQEARRCLRIGGFLSFSGIVTFANAAELRQVVTHCPLDHLLIETDSPFLTRSRIAAPQQPEQRHRRRRHRGAAESLRARSLGCRHLVEHREGLRARSLRSSSPRVESRPSGSGARLDEVRSRACWPSTASSFEGAWPALRHGSEHCGAHRPACAGGRGDHVVEIGAGSVL